MGITPFLLTPDNADAVARKPEMMAAASDAEVYPERGTPDSRVSVASFLSDDSRVGLCNPEGKGTVLEF